MHRPPCPDCRDDPTPPRSEQRARGRARGPSGPSAPQSLHHQGLIYRGIGGRPLLTDPSRGKGGGVVWGSQSHLTHVATHIRKISSETKQILFCVSAGPEFEPYRGAESWPPRHRP